MSVFVDAELWAYIARALLVARGAVAPAQLCEVAGSHVLVVPSEPGVYRGRMLVAK